MCKIQFHDDLWYYFDSDTLLSLICVCFICHTTVLVYFLLLDHSEFSVLFTEPNTASGTEQAFSKCLLNE